MDLALEGVHVLVTGTLLYFKTWVNATQLDAQNFAGASGGIGLETVRLFVGQLLLRRNASQE